MILVFSKAANNIRLQKKKIIQPSRKRSWQFPIVLISLPGWSVVVNAPEKISVERLGSGR